VKRQLTIAGLAAEPCVNRRTIERAMCGQEMVRARDSHPWITDASAGDFLQKCMNDRRFCKAMSSTLNSLGLS
jgi:hypothetical protein